MRDLEPITRRAPSAHNTQPWTLHYAPDHITIGWDEDRELPAGDPTRRDLYLSLGAFVETSLIAATDAGLPVRAEVAVDASKRVAARLLPACEPYATPYTTDTITARGCARGAHEPGRLRTDQLTRVREQLRDTALTELPARALAGQARDADRWLFGSPAVVRELRAWMRLGGRSARARAGGDDGLTAAALGLSASEAVAFRAALAALAGPLRHLGPSRLGLPRLLARSQAGLLRYDGSVLVLTGPAEPLDPSAMVTAGRDLVRCWYALTELGLAVHPLSQLIDCPDTASALRRRLGTPPLAIFRAGRPTAPPPRSKRLHEEP